uniref:Uncharacterized protein n=1 Tax=Chrysotila carterae TaxID=13221 RepID=A0A7S4EWE9_CHRCT|mmetsp:Transcript_28489/g.55123  ORF Transcript_28489/g.55123 Transcript_28489/m.55123 type:complete len:106 (+) Transcript_28489:529-846(+)
MNDRSLAEPEGIACFEIDHLLAESPVNEARLGDPWPETRNTLLRALAMSSPAHQGVNEPGHENRCSVHVEANHRNMMLLWATPRGRQQVCHNPSFAGGTPSGRMQ